MFAGRIQDNLVLISSTPHRRFLQIRGPSSKLYIYIYIPVVTRGTESAEVTRMKLMLIGNEQKSAHMRVLCSIARRSVSEKTHMGKSDKVLNKSTHVLRIRVLCSIARRLVSEKTHMGNRTKYLTKAHTFYEFSKPRE